MKVTEVEYSNGCYVKSINARFLDENHECLLNVTEDIRTNMVTTIAAISRGNDGSKNPTSRYKKLLEEAAPNVSLKDLSKDGKVNKVAGRALEFAPVKLILKEPHDYNPNYYIGFNHRQLDIPVSKSVFLNDIMPFSYLENGFLYTNIRALVNAGVSYDLIPYSYIDNYEVVEVKAPYFAFAQVRTHGRLSQIAVSERVVKEDEYWLPEGTLHNVRTTLTSKYIKELNLNCIECTECMYGKRINACTTTKELTDIFLELPIAKVQKILKIAGYDKELYDRWPNHLKMKRWIIGGYTNDPKQWSHFLLEREAYPEKYKSWVQEATREVAENIKKVIIDGKN